MHTLSLPLTAPCGGKPWSSDSWQGRPADQHPNYDDPAALRAVLDRLRCLPPLVTSSEVESLKRRLAEVGQGHRFILQGGDCAESFSECCTDVIAGKLIMLLQMSLVLVVRSKKPVVRIGRFAGQYAKPRSSPTEVRRGPDGTKLELPSYFGDLMNRATFTLEARRLDPQLLLSGYQHAALTLNFLRSLTGGGFADLDHSKLWNLSLFEDTKLSSELRQEYQYTVRQLAEEHSIVTALGEASFNGLSRVEFYTSHEGLNLHYESAQTRAERHWSGHYCLTAHLPWIGERTRALDGAHVEFFRGIQNPIGVKLGPSAEPDEVMRLIEVLNPDDQPGKIVLIPRLGVEQVERALPPLVEVVKKSGRRVVWVSDPMHGNTIATSTGVKTRRFDSILQEVELSFDVHEGCGSILGGVHFELTSEDVTECLGGVRGITEGDLDKNYTSLCDPRLNYHQAMEMAFRIAKRMSHGQR